MNPRVRMRGALVGAVVALTFALSWSLAKVPALEDKADAAAGEVSTLKPQVQVLNENQKKLITAMDEANRRLVALGKTPVPVPSVTPSSAPGLTAADVRLIVTQELADQNITITQAEVSQIARTVTALKTSMPTQISTSVKLAVAAYCLEDRCVGKPGTPGPKGDKGDKGEPGKDAPKVTDAELLRAAQQALLSYCGQDTKPCQGTPGTPGKDGADGTDGADGKDGRGIADTDCLEDGTWRITYSDGTTQIVRGPCRIVLPPAQPTN